ncbi:MAG: DNA-formamidopyrimidine glycosylase [Fidelibacterota bacterium]
MPELPEVQTVVHYLKPYLKGKTIKSVEPLNGNEKVFVIRDLKVFQKEVAGQLICNVLRRGKYIIIDLAAGYLCIHLRMTGRLMANFSDRDNPKHFTARLSFTDGTSLYFKDYRKFGRIYFSRELDWLESKLGVEPLSKQFTAKRFYAALQHSGRMIKPLLLDQGFIAGLGNIYVDEALWSAQIHPCFIAKQIEFKQVVVLHRAIRSILRKAIVLNGTTIINFTFGNNRTGSYADQLQVFGKQGKPCPHCNTILLKIRISQRGTHICPNCQKL